ncbi:MAG TPA: hypothetical protein VFE14_01425 [Micromonosporaceae bacterium]|jgi:hypothetical protein|nr:hypothetical protein [Micromonosporaceae bacterium]
MTLPHTDPPATDPDEFPLIEPLSGPLEPAGPTDDTRAAVLRPHHAHARRWRIAAIVAGAAAVALAIGYGPTAWHTLREKDATVTTPAQAGGLTLDQSEQARGTADYLRTALAAELGLEHPVGAVYADASAPSRSVIFVGGTAFLRAPEKDLDEAFRLLSDQSSAVSGIRSMSPGQLGGVMKCGTTTSPDGDMAICGWADHGSLAIAMFPGRSVDDSATLLRNIRRDVLHRG